MIYKYIMYISMYIRIDIAQHPNASCLLTCLQIYSQPPALRHIAPHVTYASQNP